MPLAFLNSKSILKRNSTDRHDLPGLKGLNCAHDDFCMVMKWSNAVYYAHFFFGNLVPMTDGSVSPFHTNKAEH